MERRVAAAPATEVYRDLKIAVMGCAVNGPGEAKRCGYRRRMWKRQGRDLCRAASIMKTVSEEEIADEIIKTGGGI